jgi:maltose/moltooligosaccharide transporter
MSPNKPRLTFWQIVNMNLGFFGLQFSFGLEQNSMSAIYDTLGADPEQLPLLWLAGPIAGLFVQPIVGAWSDQTLTRWGRRIPFFFVGALVGTLGLIAMPFSQAVWMAFSIQWALDVANNVTMEPYRAFVGDKLPPAQQSTGFLTQSAFTGLGQTLAYLTPSVLVFFGLSRDLVTSSNIPDVTLAAFLIGAVSLSVSIFWSIRTTPEIPLSAEQIAEIQRRPRGLGHLCAEIVSAIRDMPPTMRQLGLVYLFQWYALFCYWQYVVHCFAGTLFRGLEPAAALREANLLNGKAGGYYNFIAFVGAFALVPVARRFGPKLTHQVCLVGASASLFLLPTIETPWLLFLPMTGIGLAWASIMGNPYAILAPALPPARLGVYMGIFNMFICLPMILQGFTLPLLYHPVLGGDPANVMRLAGGLLLLAAIAMLGVRTPPRP